MIHADEKLTNDNQKPKQYKYSSTQKIKSNPLGKDDSADVLLQILIKEGNVCIGTKRYRDIIASYKKLFKLKDSKEAERKFIRKLSKVCNFTCSIRYVEPKVKTGNDDAGFYVIEEVQSNKKW